MGLTGRPSRAGNLPDQLAGRRPVSRRRFLEIVAAAGAGAVIAPSLAALDGPSVSQAGPVLPPGYVPSYPDGVIAGDPLSDGSVIWTRVGRPTGGEPIPVLWEVAIDAGFGVIAAGGIVTADGADDHAVKIAVDGLDSDSWYHYRFTVGDTTSPTGRLRTAPRPEATPDRLRFAFASCQQRNDSTYVALRAIADEPDLDFFMHLGDYIYVHDQLTQTLADYRGRYHSFKSNPLLQLCQQTVPLVAMFDDGEFYNGIDSTGPPARLAAAKQAWFETFPVIPPPGDPNQAHRALPWGNLADIFMIDVRSYRDPAVDAIDTTTPAGAVMLDDGRTTLGGAQKSWLKDGLAGSDALWRFLGNPYNMGMWRIADLDPGPPRPPGIKVGEGVYAPNEAWDDYSAERRELLEFIRDEDIANVISCSAHTHIFLASDMPPDPDDPSSPVVAFDFTSGSLTADPDLLIDQADPVAFLQGLTNLAHHFVDVNPLTYVNFVNQGYVVVEVTPCATTLEFKTVDVYDVDAEAEVMARFRIHTGADRMESEFFPAPAYSAGEGVTQEPPPGATGLTPVGTDCVPLTEPNDPSDPAPPGDAIASEASPQGAVAPSSSRPAAAERSSPRFTG